MKSILVAPILLLVTLVATPVAHAQYELPPPPGEGPTPTEPSAETAYLPPEPMVEATAERPLRKGFLGGAAFGLGSVTINCTGRGCGDFAGVGLSFDAGWAFSPKWALLADLWFTGGVNGDNAGQMWSFSGNFRYWLLDRFWLQGGLGFTGYDMLRKGQRGSVVSAGGGGFVLAAGADLWRSASGHLVIDLRAKLGFMSVAADALGDTTGNPVGARQTTAMVTINWY